MKLNSQLTGGTNKAVSMIELRIKLILFLPARPWSLNLARSFLNVDPETAVLA